MALIRVMRFGGLMPLVDPAKMPEHRATIATACRFQGGNLRQWRQGINAYAPQTPGNFSADVRDLMHIGPNQFLAWTGGDVTAVRGPIPYTYVGGGSVQDFRIYFAGDTGDSPQWPQYTTRYRAMDNANPATWLGPPNIKYPLGVPAPPTSVTTINSGTPTGTVTALRKGNPVQVDCAAAHGLTAGARVKLTGLEGAAEDAAALNNSTYGISIVNTTSFKLDSVDGSEWEADITGLSGTWTRDYSDSEVTDRVYVMTYVSQFGEEGRPSPVSAQISVGDGQGVLVTMSTAASVAISGGPTINVTKKRLYRSASGTGQANFLFVVELELAQAQFVDNYNESQLGEIIETDEYDLPPQKLRNLTSLENGIVAGSVDNNVYFCEPYLPYAWPTRYRRTTSHAVVGMASYGSTLVVGTTENPVIMQGTDPQSMTDRKLEEVYPLLDRHAMVSTGYSVLYPSTTGLVKVDDSGARVLTLDYFTLDQWLAIVRPGGAVVPLHAAFHSGRYVLVIGTTTYIFEILGDQIEVSTAGSSIPNGAAVAVDRSKEDLYYMASSAFPGGRVLYRFDPSSGSTYVAATWRSRTFHLPREANFSCIQVFASSYSTPVQVNIYCDGVLKFTGFFESQNVKRLPGGFWARDWQVEIIASTEVQAVHIADSVRELQQVAL